MSLTMANTDLYFALLNLMMYLPLVGIPVLLLLPKASAKYVAMAFSLMSFIVSIVIYKGYLDASALELSGEKGGYLFYKAFEMAEGTFLSGFDIKYAMGIDGISIYLVLLTTLLFPLSIWFSWKSIEKLDKGYYSLLLLLQTGVLGVFMSLDIVLFYMFFEVGLIPMYFLIGIWGGKDRIYASLKFFLYTLAGSVLLLLGVIYLGQKIGPYLGNDIVFTSDLQVILQYLFSPDSPVSLSWDEQIWLFLAFAVSFAIKVPMFPVHTWLPDAHVQAPTAGSVILAGVLLKMGTYGLIRFCLPLFPEASLYFAPAASILALIGIIYGAMAAMVQTDIKKLVAYSSVAHMGFVVLGIFAMTKEAMSGSVLQMINHGISTGALFLIVGMIYDRRHTREIKDFQGVAKVMPIFTLFFIIATMSSIGLPGLNGFVGEFLILLGSFGSSVIQNWVVIVATTGVILAAVYMLWMFRRVMFGELDKEENKALVDLNGTEVAVLIPLTLLMFIIGFWATPFLDEINRSSDFVVNSVLQALPSVASH